MSNFTKDMLERKLIKPLANSNEHRTITVENRTANDGYKFQLKIDNSTVPKKASLIGLMGQSQRQPNIQIFTPKILRVTTIEEGIEFAEKEFQRSVEHEKYEPLPAGTDFPF